MTLISILSHLGKSLLGFMAVAVFALGVAFDASAVPRSLACGKALHAPSASVYTLPTSSKSSLKIRQKLALQMLQGFQGDELDSKISKAASIKLPFYADTQVPAELFEIAKKQSPEQIGSDSLLYVLQTFRSPGDELLREAAITELGRHSGSSLSTIENLLPLVRGSDGLGAEEFEKAGIAIQKIQQNPAAKIPDFYLTERNWLEKGSKKSRRNILKHAQIETIGPISAGNNVNSTLLLTLRTKKGEKIRGVFKPFLGESTIAFHSRDQILFTREIQAYDLFEEIFSHPQIFVPETLEVIVAHKGVSYGVGSLQLFAEGMKTVNFISMKGKPVDRWEHYDQVWEAQRKDPRWATLAPWIQVFDWVIGNMDRFPNSQYSAGNPNNIMVNEEALSPSSVMEVGLIDNGNGRKGMSGWEFDPDRPKASSIPKGLQTMLASLTTEKFTQLRERFRSSLSPAGVNDFINRLQALQRDLQEKK